jgi:hypothetical protein
MGLFFQSSPKVAQVDALRFGFSFRTHRVDLRPSRVMK